jgi:hypothetical protein
MQVNELLKYYWEIFLSHTCEFYPLDKDFIERYEFELDWKAISKNRELAWDLEFLEKYETRFIWHELAGNESILWDEEKIDRFKKRLDWYYLGRNRNLPITESFIVKYAKKLFVVEDNPMLSKSLIDKYSIKTVPKNTHDTQEIKDYKESDFDNIFNKFIFHHNQRVIYEKVVLPVINDITLEKIFEEKFDYSQRYYFLEPVHDDVHGLTPEFKIQDDNPFDKFQEERGLLTLSNRLTLINGSLQEGPDRLYEIPRFSSFSFYTTILVSENIKQILDRFKLPEHTYHEVDLVPKKIKTNTKFYILQIAFDTLNKDLIYESRSFHFSFKDFKKRGHGLVDEKISSHAELMAIKDKLGKIYSPTGYGVTLTPDRYNLNSDFDLYSYSVHGKVIVNQFLKNALEKNFAGQLLFKSAQLLKIRIDQEKYDEKAKLAINTKLSSKVSFTESDDDKFFFAKRDRLENFDAPRDTTNGQEDKFTKKETELNVSFSETFKNQYSAKRIKIKGYHLLPISKFYIQNEYADRFPETYKSVAIAENGLGDSINLMLERDSDHKLQSTLFEFLHETGEYEEV